MRTTQATRQSNNFYERSAYRAQAGSDSDKIRMGRYAARMVRRRQRLEREGRDTSDVDAELNRYGIEVPKRAENKAASSSTQPEKTAGGFAQFRTKAEMEQEQAQRTQRMNEARSDVAAMKKANEEGEAIETASRMGVVNDATEAAAARRGENLLADGTRLTPYGTVKRGTTGERVGRPGIADESGDRTGEFVKPRSGALANAAQPPANLAEKRAEAREKTAQAMSPAMKPSASDLTVRKNTAFPQPKAGQTASATFTPPAYGPGEAAFYRKAADIHAKVRQVKESGMSGGAGQTIDQLADRSRQTAPTVTTNGNTRQQDEDEKKKKPASQLTAA